MDCRTLGDWIQDGKDSDAQPIRHGDIIGVGSTTKFEAHVHPGNGYCSKCRHAWVADTATTGQQASSSASLSAPPIRANHYNYTPGESFVDRNREVKKSMQQLKKEIIPSEKRGTTATHVAAPQLYVDRAQIRREAVGSEPHIDYAAQEIYRPAPIQATDQTRIDSGNVGHQLLTKMGWKGSGLGKNEQGHAEPIALQKRSERAGLGL
eukprot:m.181761 g.181761  ORF g.181761 m.181761 type:complete len:208 (+) comp16633_c1_seq4:1029-1652(+)